MTTLRKKNRLETFLYKEGYFFITINVQNHACVFGEVVGEEMKNNQYGKIVEKCWYDLPNHYGNCKLLDLIIMPNHLHAIISVEKGVGEGFKPSLTKKHGLSEVIRGFKTFSSRRLHESGLTSFKRQRSFYDHVIRNEQDLLRIQEYIHLNSYKRKNDEYYIG
ncbi:MAG: hypothetical protein NT085_02280 [candidate division SR1 bacterium]|nr:hypothetical protein [candidate division SR1 bacterium]